MTLRTVLHYPNPRLRVVARPVTTFDAELQKLVNDMFETMYENHGGGLAATQIDVPLRVVVIDPTGSQEKQIVLINPEIMDTKGQMINEEGCLSVPDIFEEVERAEYVKMKAQDVTGKEFIIESSGDYLAACLQHETDHLNGKLFVDYLSLLKQERIRKKIEKMKRRVL
jgi:peptide deformylase